MFGQARLDDVDELLALYRRIYGDTYPLPFATDPAAMSALIGSDEAFWLTVRSGVAGPLVGAMLATVDPSDRLAKVQGMVVAPESRGSGIANRLVATMAEGLLEDGRADSIYGTARTTSTAPQRTHLRNGFHALGMFPNLHKTQRAETMLLVARYREGVLAQRHPVERVPRALRRLVDIIDKTIGMPAYPSFEVESCVDAAPGAGVEIVDAPLFVLRHFEREIVDPVRRFYPFHDPNILIADTGGAYEVYAHLNRVDGYCTLLGATPGPMSVAPHLDRLIDRLTRIGAHYVETLVPLHCFDELSALLACGFLPAALYPAMRAGGGLFHDYVVMARTLQPLDFRGLAIDAAFQPFVEQYIDLWKQRFLDTEGVFR
ncbi:GNAT family N-acetyltransferase [Umezawaea endophytica]